jgi:glycosyltransferase involved in cell wall biosynthesis
MAIARRHDFVLSPGLLSHRETAALMRSADLLFLPMHDVAGRAGLIPYKTFEYLAAERPILAAVPDGDVRDMLAGIEHVTLVRPADVGAMAEALLARVAAGRVGQVRDGIGSPALRPLERQACVGRIAEVLDGVLAAPGRQARIAA